MYLYRVAYDGTKFYGFTGHPKSVEAVLKPALGDVLSRGSRTDPGVSAVANVVLVERRQPFGYINSKLPEGVWVWGVAEVPEGFNPRRAKWRRYLYVAPHWGEDVEAMREAADLLKGTHDFASFIWKRGERNVSTVLTIDDISIYIKGPLVYIYYKGRGFRNKMIRKLTWAILAVGRGTLSIRDLSNLLERPRPGAVPSAPAEGLLLLDIAYDVSFEVDTSALRKAYLYFLERFRQMWALAYVYREAGEALAMWEEF